MDKIQIQPFSINWHYMVLYNAQVQLHLVNILVNVL